MPKLTATYVQTFAISGPPSTLKAWIPSGALRGAVLLEPLLPYEKGDL